MAEVQRVAVVNDLSGFGRCSLTVALPILSIMGFQACPLPTAVLSAHTGYDNPYIQDFTPGMEPYLRHWEQLGLSFAGVYTGFLGNEQQADILEPFLRQQKADGALVLVDPAMADHGRLYASCAPGLVQAMGKLAAYATVITPNLTEACLLTGMDYESLCAFTGENLQQAMRKLGKSLLALGCEAAVITGVQEEEGRLENWAFSGDLEPHVISTQRVDCNYAGTGDVFASVLCGCLLQGMSLSEGVARTAEFVCRIARRTAEEKGAEQDGMMFEPLLRELFFSKNA